MILFPLALYAVAGPVTAYFLWHAANGDRGLKARENYERQVQTLLAEANALATEKQALERSIAMMRRASIDRDILDEQARVMLGRVRKDEVVIFVPNDSH